MLSFAIAAPRAASRHLVLLASTVVASGLLAPLASWPAFAQQSASPDLDLPEVVVSRRPVRRPAPSPAPSVRRAPAVVQPAEVPPGVAAPDANAPVVYSPTAVATPARDIGSSVTVITAGDIEREQRRTVPDALANVPGLNIVQTGGPGGQTSVFMRGTNSNQVKVLIDGIDVSDPSNPNRSFDFGQLLTADIERIEVLRGPQSGLYGADAVGGLISIITKKGEGPPKATALVEGGSFGTFNQIAGLSGGDQRGNYSFTAAHFRTASTPVTPLELIPPDRQRINDTWNNWTYSAKLGANLTPDFTVNWVGRFTDATLYFTGDDFSVFPAVPNAIQSTQAVHQFYQRGEAVWSTFGGKLVNYFGVNYTDTWNWNKAPDPTAPNINRGDRIRYDWHSVAEALPGQIMIVGAQQETERLNNNNLETQQSLLAHQRMNSTYLEFQNQVANRLFLVSNVRYDDNDAFGNRTTYRIAPALLVPFTETKLKGSIGTGFKAPTLSQLYSDFRPVFNFVGNPNLLPEDAIGYDFGFEQPLFYDRFRFGVTRYNIEITNLIVPNATFTSNTNIGNAQTSGYEAFFSAAVTDRFRVRGDYTYTRAIDGTTGLDLLRRPRHKYTLQGDWNPIDPLTLSVTWLRVSTWIDGNRDFSIPRLTASGYAVLNFAANYKVNQYTTAFARVDNALNERYQNPTGFDRPGLGVYGGVKVTSW
jgi:vitamin B12 transporter